MYTIESIYTIELFLPYLKQSTWGGHNTILNGYIRSEVGKSKIETTTTLRPDIIKRFKEVMDMKQEEDDLEVFELGIKRLSSDQIWRILTRDETSNPMFAFHLHVQFEQDYPPLFYENGRWKHEPEKKREQNEFSDDYAWISAEHDIYSKLCPGNDGPIQEFSFDDFLQMAKNYAKNRKNKNITMVDSK